MSALMRTTGSIFDGRYRRHHYFSSGDSVAITYRRAVTCFSATLLEDMAMKALFITFTAIGCISAR